VTVINRRNAVVGWVALGAGKRYIRRKVRPEPKKRPWRSTIAVGLAGLAGALLFWRKRSGGGDD